MLPVDAVKHVSEWRCPACVALHKHLANGPYGNWRFFSIACFILKQLSEGLFIFTPIQFGVVHCCSKFSVPVDHLNLFRNGNHTSRLHI